MPLSHYDTDMMKTKAKRILELIKIDLKANYVLLITIFLAWLLIRWLTHAFCPSIIFCGLPCPGCGLTRAGKALMVHDFDTAWERCEQRDFPLQKRSQFLYPIARRR